MKFTKNNNPNKKRKKKRISKSEYIPTLQEITYCWNNEIKPENYINFKYMEE